LKGDVDVRGGVALVSQRAWIQNCSVKDAVLFHSPYDSNKYDRVLDACQLLPDIAMLPNGDSTEIGERFPLFKFLFSEPYSCYCPSFNHRGINLSGGQQQRIALARAAYRRDSKHVYLLDDPLSAVDVHVASLLWKSVVVGLLKDKTRLVVLNSHYHLARQADMVPA
jgi:ABC-type multidrug transport system fused ATPase/permease subunit